MFELRKWEPMKEIGAIEREMNDLFKRFFGSSRLSGIMESGTYPAIDCYYKQGEFIVHADLPGIDPKDMDITLTGNVLTIKGERNSTIDEKKEGYFMHETSFGSFSRSFTLPAGVNTEKVKATYKNGVLELSMPTEAASLPKKVAIEINEGKEAKSGKKAA